MGNTIGLEDWYIDETITEKITQFTKEDIEKYIESAKQKKTDYGVYKNTDKWLHEAFEIIPIEGKTVAIMGSIYPWYEAMTLAYGGFPTTVEYNLPNYNFPGIKEILLKDLIDSKEQFDIGISISSFEHDGLGRYGDPINPNGDLRAMSEMKNILKPGGILFLAVPMGIDKIVWNAHRVYGSKRLKTLLEHWTIIGSVGYDENIASMDMRKVGKYQPIIVLENT